MSSVTVKRLPGCLSPPEDPTLRELDRTAGGDTPRSERAAWTLTSGGGGVRPTPPTWVGAKDVFFFRWVFSDPEGESDFFFLLKLLWKDLKKSRISSEDFCSRRKRERFSFQVAQVGLPYSLLQGNTPPRNACSCHGLLWSCQTSNISGKYRKTGL